MNGVQKLCWALIVMLFCASCDWKNSDVERKEFEINTSQIFVQHQKIIDPRDNTEIQMRGVNLGQWFLLESYLWGLYPESGYQEYNNISEWQLLEKLKKILPKNISLENFLNQYRENFITSWDFKYLKNLGINTLRIPLHYNTFENEEKLRHLKKVISWCEEFELFCILDLHVAPGAQSTYSHSESLTGEALFWKDEKFEEEYFEYLEILSDLTKDEFFILGYDILNEPQLENVRQLKEFYEKAVSFLRKRGNSKILFLQTNEVSTRVEEIYLGDEFKNIIYSVHYYGLEHHANEELRSVWNFSQEKNVPILMGEYGNWANDFWAEYFDKYMIYTFEVYNFHHLYWPYKDLIPSNEKNDNNFGLFSGPKTELWQEFFEALSNEIPLRNNFPFAKFFTQIRSENLEEKEFVVRLFKIPQKGIVETEDFDSIFQGNRPWWFQEDESHRFGEWEICNGKTFAECRRLFLQ